MEFNRELIMKPNTVVHCKTQEEADALCEAFPFTGFSGGSAAWFRPDWDYADGICYYLQCGQWCGVSDYSEDDYTILSFSEILVQDKEALLPSVNADKDFRIGDVVCSCADGDGIVKELNPESKRIGSLKVEFKNWTLSFFEDGRQTRSDLYPSLFHGTYEEVFGGIKDKLPARKTIKYLNVFLDINNNPVAYLHESEEKALANVKNNSTSIYLVVAEKTEVTL